MLQSTNGPRLGRTDLLMFLTVLLWAINVSVLKIGLRTMSPHGFNAVRLSLAAIAYLAVLTVSRGKFSLARKGDGWKAAGLGLLGITGYQIVFIQALARMNASTASVVMGTSPIFIALLATAVGKERISLAGWIGIAISVVGFLLVVTGGDRGLVFTWEALRGAVMILVANACWAAYTVFSKPVLERNSSFRLAAVGTIAGTLAYLPFAAKDLAAVEWARIPWQGWGAILYSGLVAIFLCFVLWYQSVQARCLRQPHSRPGHSLRGDRARRAADPPPSRRRGHHSLRRLPDAVRLQVLRTEIRQGGHERRPVE
jgi:drug/metabolite transporter (DMT)-like permease